MNEIRLFVQPGCRPCIQVENLLKKVDDWQSAIRLVNIQENEEFAKYCGVIGTPTLVGLQDGKVVAKLTGPEYLTFDFFLNLVRKHGKGTPK